MASRPCYDNKFAVKIKVLGIRIPLVKELIRNIGLLLHHPWHVGLVCM